MKGISGRFPPTWRTTANVSKQGNSAKPIEKMQNIRNAAEQSIESRSLFIPRARLAVPDARVGLRANFFQRAKAIETHPATFYGKDSAANNSALNHASQADPIFTAPSTQAEIEAVLNTVQDRASLHMAYNAIREHRLFPVNEFKAMVVSEARNLAKVAQQKALAAEFEAISAFSRGAQSSYYSERNELFKAQAQNLLALAELISQPR